MKTAGSLIGPDEAADYERRWTPSPASTMALVAAAGRGTRLGFHLPKVLYPVDGRPVLAWLGYRLDGLVRSLALVLSPDGARSFEGQVVDVPMPLAVAQQSEPTGMADAILAAEGAIDDQVATVIVLWGDQIGVQRETMVRALAVHESHELKPAVTVPLARVDVPYVHYDFDGSGRLSAVRQRREGDVLPDSGLADCGCFVVSPRVVFPALRRLRAAGLLRGRLSHEENFLQALPFLAREAPVVGVTGATSIETIGLNSTVDLERLNRAANGDAPRS